MFHIILRAIPKERERTTLYRRPSTPCWHAFWKQGLWALPSFWLSCWNAMAHFCSKPACCSYLENTDVWAVGSTEGPGYSSRRGRWYQRHIAVPFDLCISGWLRSWRWNISAAVWKVQIWYVSMIHWTCIASTNLIWIARKSKSKPVERTAVVDADLRRVVTAAGEIVECMCLILCSEPNLTTFYR